MDEFSQVVRAAESEPVELRDLANRVVEDHKQIAKREGKSVSDALLETLGRYKAPEERLEREVICNALGIWSGYQKELDARARETELTVTEGGAGL